jgi:hypothetical protein
MAIDIDEGSSAPSASFEKPGQTHAGTILAAERRQDRDFKTGQPKTWPDGNPVMVYAITIATDADEELTIWARGGSYTPARGKGDSMMNAIDDAVRAAGAKTIDAGGQISVTFSGFGRQDRAGFKPPKLYSATYSPPSSGFAVGEAAGDEAPFDDEEPFDDEPF